MQMCMWPVDVICLSSANGEIRPLRLRASEGMAETFVGNVSEILATRKTHLMGGEIETFLCRVSGKTSATVLELKFFRRSHSWYLLLPTGLP